MKKKNYLLTSWLIWGNKVVFSPSTPPLAPPPLLTLVIGGITDGGNTSDFLATACLEVLVAWELDCELFRSLEAAAAPPPDLASFFRSLIMLVTRNATQVSSTDRTDTPATVAITLKNFFTSSLGKDGDGFLREVESSGLLLRLVQRRLVACGVIGGWVVVGIVLVVVVVEVVLVVVVVVVVVVGSGLQ